MLKIKQIAITGGIASGKSTVCRFFQKLGALTIAADQIVHELLVPYTDLGQQIIQLLGPTILGQGTLNRQAIADLVFKNPGLLDALEKLLHPPLLERIDAFCKTASHTGAAACVVEIPLLYEIGAQDRFDTTIAVLAPRSLCRERFCKAGFTEEDFELRMKRQLPPEEKAKRADYVIYNDGSLEGLRQSILALQHLLQPHSLT